MNISNSSGDGKKKSIRDKAGWGYIAADMFTVMMGVAGLASVSRKERGLRDGTIPIDSVNYDLEDIKSERNQSKALIAQGFLWSIGGWFLAAFGKQPVEKQADLIEERVLNFLNKEGVALDSERKQKAEAYEHRSVKKRIQEFVYNYPIEIMNTFYGAVAAYTLVFRGFMLGRETEGANIGKFKGRHKIRAGTLIVLGAIASFIREKGPIEIEKEGKPDTLVGKGVQFVQSRPLGLASMIYMGNNYFLTRDAIRDYQLSSDTRDIKFNNKNYIFEGSAVLAYVASNLIVGTGSKKATGSKEEHEESRQAIIQMTAEILSKESPDRQQTIAVKLAEYLVKQRELRFEDYKPVVEELAQQIIETIPRAQKDVQPRAAVERDIVLEPSYTVMPDAPMQERKARAIMNFEDRVKIEGFARNAVASLV